MIVTPRILLRLALIVIGGVILQLSFFSQISLFHTSPDILPALVVSLGLLGGGMSGAVAGFSVGFFLDCLLVEALGTTSLVLLCTGYLAGLYRERFELSGTLAPALLCMGLTLLAEVMLGVVQLLLGADSTVSGLVVRDMVIKSIFAFFLAFPIYRGVRRALRPALIEDDVVRPRARSRVLGA